MTGSARPNIVVVLADDLGWGDLSCYGASKIRTPNIDSLASEGIRFTDAHAASAVCTPSRYALLTGRYCWRSPLKDGVLMGHGPALIEPSRDTIASVLRSAGYSTAAIGKWHLGLGWKHLDGSIWDAFSGSDPLQYELGDPLVKHREMDIDSGTDIDYSKPFSGGPLELGFEEFFGISGSLNMPPYAFLRQDRTVGVPRRKKRRFLPSQRPGFESEDWDEREVDLNFTAEAVRFIEHQDKDNPFFLYFAPSAPHRPQVPPAFLKGSSQAGPRGDSVVFVDWMVGELRRSLHNRGLLEDTLFLFTSDNGAPTIFPDDGDTVEHRANGPWRGQKGDAWDGGHREPFMACWPGNIPSGTVTDARFGLIDLLPTIAALLRLELPSAAAPDGLDRSAALLGAPLEDTERPLILHSMGGAFSILDGRWKAIFATGSGGGLSEPKGNKVSSDQPLGQLYDVALDPFETTNLWDERPDVVSDLYASLVHVVQQADNGLPLDLGFNHSYRTRRRATEGDGNGT